MSCTATRPFVSRADARFIRPDPLESLSGLAYEEVRESVNNPFVRANITPDRALEISKLIPRVVATSPDFLETVPAVKARLVGSQFINPFELADMITVAGYDGDDLFNELAAHTGTELSNDLKGFYKQLDFYYDEYLSLPYNPGRCEELYNIWQLIVQVELIVKTAMNWIARIKDFTLQQLIDKLLDIERLIKEFMKRLVETIKQRLIQLATQFLEKIGIFIDNIEAVATWIINKVSDIQEYLSESNIEKIADDIGNEIKRMFGSLEEFSISNIAYMLWRLCSIIESIKDFFKNPLALFTEGLIAFTSARILLESMGDQKREAAARAGHIRVSPEEAAAQRDAIIAAGNGNRPGAPGTTAPPADTRPRAQPRFFPPSGGGSSPGSVPDPTNPNSTPPPPIDPADLGEPTDPLIPPRTATGEELAWLTGMLASPDNDILLWTDDVKYMHAWTVNAYERARRNLNDPNEGAKNRDIVSRWDPQTHPVFEGAGYKWPIRRSSGNSASPVIALRRINLGMREKFQRNFRFQVNSAYRHPIYDRWRVGGSGGGQHTSGTAFDISTNGWSISEQIYFVYLAISYGMRGIGLYKTFMHVDTRANKNFWDGEDPEHRPTRLQYDLIYSRIQTWHSTGQFPLPEGLR